MNAIDIEDYDEQLARAAEADAAPDPSAAVVRRLNHEEQCQRAHAQAERAVRVLLLLLLLGIYFGWLA